MKKIKLYESFVTKHIKFIEEKLSKIKKYAIVKHEYMIFFDEIIDKDIRHDSIHLKDLYVYYTNDDSIEKLYSEDYSDVHFHYFDGTLFTSDDYDECYKFFMDKVNLIRDVNKYNL